MPADCDSSSDEVLQGDYDETAERADGGDRRSRRSEQLALALIGGLGALAVLALHGLLPGLRQTRVQSVIAPGAIECLSERGLGMFTGWCDQLGQPIGQPLLSGAAQIYLGALINLAPGVDASAAHVLTDILCDIAGFFGCYALARRWGALPVPSAVGAMMYLSSAIVVSTNGLAATFDGILLLPVHIALALWALDRFDAQRHRAAASIALLVSCLVAVFTDGYTFVISSFVVVLLACRWLIQASGAARDRAVASIVVFGSLLLAVTLYRLYVPAGAADAEAPIDFFRAMGGDLLTYFLPSDRIWLFDTLGATVDYSGAWGDIKNVEGNYLGWMALALGGWGIWASRRNAEVLTFCGAAVAAFVFSLGPSLKIGSFGKTGGADPYSMPKSEGVVDLPLAWFVTKVPGLSDMRAIYRWVVVPVLVLTLAIAIATSKLWKSGRRGLAVGLTGLAVLEVFVNAPNVVEDRRADRVAIAKIEDGPARSLVHALEPGERVLFVPSANDFLVNYLIPPTGASAYNIGVDKNVRLSQANWPEAVRAVVYNFTQPDFPDLVVSALISDADAIVIPSFHLWGGALEWPSGDTTGILGYGAQMLEADDRFDVTKDEWFTIFRLAASR